MKKPTAAWFIYKDGSLERRELWSSYGVPSILETVISKPGRKVKSRRFLRETHTIPWRKYMLRRVLLYRET